MTTSKDPQQNGDDANASRPPKPEQQPQPQAPQQKQQQSADKKAAGDAKDGAGHKSASPPKKRRKVNHGAQKTNQSGKSKRRADAWLTGSDSLHLLQTFGEPPHSRPRDWRTRPVHDMLTIAPISPPTAHDMRSRKSGPPVLGLRVHALTMRPCCGPAIRSGHVPDVSSAILAISATMNRVSRRSARRRTRPAGRPRTRSRRRSWTPRTPLSARSTSVTARKMQPSGPLRRLHCRTPSPMLPRAPSPSPHPSPRHTLQTSPATLSHVRDTSCPALSPPSSPDDSLLTRS